MRTTLDLPEELINEAIRALGFKSKTDAVIVALRELLRRHQMDELRRLRGQVDLELDLPRSRRRPRRSA